MNAKKPGKKAGTKKAKTAKAFKKISIRLIRQSHGADLPNPKYQTELSAGMDLLAAVPENEPMTLAPSKRGLVPTGLIFEIPAGFEGQVRPRSGLALKHGVTVLNSPGTIDADYRGEVSVLLVNLGDTPFEIKRGERIAQLVIAPVIQAKLAKAKSVSHTKRGAGGFGSTGSKQKKRSVEKSKKKDAARARPIKSKSKSKSKNEKTRTKKH